MKRNVRSKMVRRVALLAVVAVSCAMALYGCAEPRFYEMSGTITITNDCDGKLESLPDTVKVVFPLVQRGETWELPDEVPLTSAAPNPVQTGSYRVSGWTEIPASHWGTPRVTRLDGRDVCEPIPCPTGKICSDMAPKEHSIPLNPKTYNIRIRCGCVDEG